VRTKNLFTQTLRICLVTAIALVASATATAQSASGYPNRTIKMIVPFGAGGGYDGIARPIAEKMSEYLKQRVIVENKAGAAGNIGAEMAMKSPPDGYTIILAGDFLTSNPFLYPSVKWDPDRDLEPISFFGRTPRVIVARTSLGVKTLPELIKLSQKQDLSYSTPGVATGPHLLMEILKMDYGFKGVHAPYKGNSQAAQDAIGGHIDMVVAPLPSVMAFIRSQRLSDIVLFSAKRSSQLPNLPVPSEYGMKGLEGDQWYALFAPKGTPEPILELLNKAVLAAMTPEMKANLLVAGYDAEPGTREELRQLVRTSRDHWGKVIKAMNLPPQ
jgi:tripartite-type tricarboxylate transporter receptor subunit TctC